MRPSTAALRFAVLGLSSVAAFLIVSCAELSSAAVRDIRDVVDVVPDVRDQPIVELPSVPDLRNLAELRGLSEALGDEPASVDPAPSAAPARFEAASRRETVNYDENGFPTYPLPTGEPEPLGPAVFNSGFRDPLPASPVWNPTGPKRVGLQVGHWNTYNVPNELRRLSAGSSAGGWNEWEAAMLIARQAKAFLEEAGVEVDLLETTIPPRYRAHAFVSIHLDGDTSGRLNGYKIARPGFSSIPQADDEFVRIMYREYGEATGMVRDSDDHISRRMTFYYAFNTRRYQHAIDLGTPAMIVETGFLTNADDRAFLTSRPDLAGRGIANGVLKFLALELGRTGS